VAGETVEVSLLRVLRVGEKIPLSFKPRPRLTDGALDLGSLTSGIVARAGRLRVGRWRRWSRYVLRAIAREPAGSGGPEESGPL